MNNFFFGGGGFSPGDISCLIVIIICFLCLCFGPSQLLFDATNATFITPRVSGISGTRKYIPRRESKLSGKISPFSLRNSVFYEIIFEIFHLKSYKIMNEEIN